MILIEMSRDLHHGGLGWEFPTCLWSPTQKESGSSWPFWDMVLQARPGDVVLHLRGERRTARFVGYSSVCRAGYRTPERPPRPSGWGWSLEFNRADLENYIPLAEPLMLDDLFARRRAELEGYFDQNKSRRGRNKRHIFLVRQSGRLQCLNGAYLSEVDAELQVAMFGDAILGAERGGAVEAVTVGTQLREVLARIGQREFSDRVRLAYNNRCCFPGCDVTDRRFLVASHIARWADNPAFRGSVGNGLCLCLNHDKAFEAGLFWLEDDLSIAVREIGELPGGSLGISLAAARGRRLKPGSASPILEAVREHRQRVHGPHRRPKTLS
jgi:putative restriction endonuclease